MITIPGDITSETARPLLRRGARIALDRETARIAEADRATVMMVLANGDVQFVTDPPGYVHAWPVFRVPPASVSLVLDDDLGMDIAARWLARHYAEIADWGTPDACAWIHQPRRLVGAILRMYCDGRAHDVEFHVRAGCGIGLRPRLSLDEYPRFVVLLEQARNQKSPEFLRLAILAAAGRAE